MYKWFKSDAIIIPVPELKHSCLKKMQQFNSVDIIGLEKDAHGWK